MPFSPLQRWPRVWPKRVEFGGNPYTTLQKVSHFKLYCRKFWTSKLSMKVAGIIACGGKSSRMQKDKSLLNYHGQTQRHHLFKLLSLVCDQVFLSLNKNQQESLFQENVIIDAPTYQDHGPIASLLSVADQFNADHYLLIGCDYPNLKKSDIELLLSGDAPIARCYGDSRFPEPLLCLYSSNAVKEIRQQFHNGNSSLSQYLRKSDPTILPKPAYLESVDTPELYSKFVQR